MRQEERDVYIIPPNFIEGGTLMGGMFKTRNVIEAGILGALTGGGLKAALFPHNPYHCPVPDHPASGAGGPDRHWRWEPVRVYPPVFQLPPQQADAGQGRRGPGEKEPASQLGPQRPQGGRQRNTQKPEPRGG